MFSEDQNLNGFPAIRHGFFGRNGGASKGLYAGLNVGYGTKDDPANVSANRALVAQSLGAAADRLCTVYQVHSADCVYAPQPFIDANRPEADAMVTDKAGIVLGVLTADCVPVLFYGEKADGAAVIGAAHAGWGGAFKNVLGRTVQMMESKGALQIQAAIGPCIAQDSYEVDDQFMRRFIEQDSGNQKFFAEAELAGHKMFDLAGYAEKSLVQAGVASVSQVRPSDEKGSQQKTSTASGSQQKGVDTYKNENDYFSYRRATHKDESDYGRQISAIVIAG